VSPVIRSELVHQIFNMKIDGSLGDRQFVRNLLVAVSVSNEPKNFKLSIRKVFVAQMLSEARCHFCRYMSISSMNRADDAEQFVLGHTLQHVRGGT